MSSTIPPKKRATVAELVARLETENEHLEIIDGEIVEKAGAGDMNEASGPSHGRAMIKIGEVVGPFDRKPGSSRGPGGWWLFTDLHVGYPSGDVYAHDLSGFRRDSHPERPASFPVMARPDWACEIISNKKRDLVIKPTTLHAAEVPHYWVLDANEKLLIVHRWSAEGYVVVLRAADGDTVRAEPFDAIEIHVSELFGDD
ncbi:MAG: Uma2 family endonuclease [Deltaproteobacteria bacterium]|nr:Uma2 family endonuclease [Deltaproteobacteria bacterium]